MGSHIYIFSNFFGSYHLSAELVLMHNNRHKCILRKGTISKWATYSTIQRSGSNKEKKNSGKPLAQSGKVLLCMFVPLTCTSQDTDSL